MYKIKTSLKDWCKKTRDDHFFVMCQSNCKNFNGPVKVGYCRGNWICPNKKCTFKDFSDKHTANCTHWKTYLGENKKVCEVCDYYAIQKGCGAWKQALFNPATGTATVYHLGTHKCMVHKIKQVRKDDEECIIRPTPEDNAQKVTIREAKKKGLDRMTTLIMQGRVEEAQQEAYCFSNPKYSAQVLTKAKQADVCVEDQNGDDCQSFDAVAIIKWGTDSYDRAYIWKINNGSMNNESDYVFLSSSKLAKQVAIQMDKDGEANCLQQEVAFFDGTFNRVFGFVSFALWVFHPTLCRVIRLANMEMRSENTADISVFFMLFNEVLQYASGDKD